MSDASYMSPAQVAEFLGISSDSVLRAVARGDLPAVKLSARVIRIARTDLDAYLAARVVKPKRR